MARLRLGRCRCIAAAFASLAARGVRGAFAPACWVAGFSRPLCCGEEPRLQCFEAGDAVFTRESCCGSAYDACVTSYLQAAPDWNRRPCGEYLGSEAVWLTRSCLAWAQGDREYEQTVVTDLLESHLARCFHVTFEAPDGGKVGHGVCVPTSCGFGEVLDSVHHLVDLRSLLGRGEAQAELDSYASTVLELAPWRALAERVDFVVAGFMNSGSSTLSATLAAHPDVWMPPTELDIPQVERMTEAGRGWSGDWRQWLCADVLPKVWLEKTFPHAGPAGGSAKRRGFKNPLLLYSSDCILRLARAMPRLIVALRDPVEWVLSMFDHNHTLLGLALHDWTPPSTEGLSRASWFGRDHAMFGTLLRRLLATWPGDRVLVVELEYLKHPATAEIALDAACRFLGIRAWSEVRADAGPLRYDRGLGASSRVWGRAELCTPHKAPGIRFIAESLREEYEALPRLLSRLGVQELGVSATLLAGGAYARHCREEVSLPGAIAGVAGLAEQVAVERRLRVTWRGELGYEFRTTSEVAVGTVACGAGDGPPQRETRVTLWDGASRTPLIIATIGPTSPTKGGFAYAEPFAAPLRLASGRTYAITVQATPGSGFLSSGHADISVAQHFAEFLGGVFSRGPWLYPSERDPFGWEQAYVSLVVIVPIG